MKSSSHNFVNWFRIWLRSRSNPNLVRSTRYFHVLFTIINLDGCLAVSLRDVLTPENLNPLFTNHPELIPALFPHLPSDLPTPPSAEALKQIISSPQFQSAVRNFDQALHTGLLGGLVRGLGLPEEAGTGVEPFLRAVQEQAHRENEESGGSGSGDQMETD